LKRIALVLCAALALGPGAVATAQGLSSQAQAATGNAVGTASSVDETTLSLSDSGATAKAAKAAAGPSTLAYFLRMLVVLALVLAAIYGVYRLMKKAAGPKTAESSAVKILASSSLGPGKMLHVVALGSKGYLIGATDSSVNLVAEIADKEYLDALELEAATNPPPREGSGREFGKVLSSLMGGKGLAGKRDSGKQRGSGGDFLAGQRDRLRKF
jgi:flagellar protein FliO/FliZ